ncbi:YybH family protein [Floridanema aerugineum]|uniref:Nuclear transport factor 2 family protein n=1 Tax=Floridaenema aerugineum BLCC-F46 TaxID=3153654 RepID=A0ABV4X9F2_9CYAN
MSTESNKVKNEVLIRTLIDELTNAIRTKDVDRLTSCYAADTVMFVLAPPLQIKGNEGSSKKNLEEWFASFQGSIGYEIRDLHITTSDEVAFCYSLNQISGTRSDGSKTDIWVRETLCFYKINSEWKILHQHQSVPFYMDGSNKAAIDLKP